MPLFDLNSALSCELPAAYELATRLSQAEAVQDLAETDVEATALTFIKVGISDDPFDGDQFTRQQLDVRHLLINVYAEPENGMLAQRSPAAVDDPLQGGALRVAIKRQIRESEDREDAYNFFWDRVSAIGPAVILSSETSATGGHRFKQCTRVYGPEFGARRASGDQGEYLEALLVIPWGDVEQEQ